MARELAPLSPLAYVWSIEALKEQYLTDAQFHYTIDMAEIVPPAMQMKILIEGLAEVCKGRIELRNELVSAIEKRHPHLLTSDLEGA